MGCRKRLSSPWFPAIVPKAIESRSRAVQPAPDASRVTLPESSTDGLAPTTSPADSQHMDRIALLLVRAATAFTFCVVLGTSAPAIAQPQATLEVQGRQGDYYWVVETAVDGSRKGGWVSAQVPLDGIDRNALRPIPSTGPVQPTPPPVTVQAAPAAPAVPAAQTQAATATPPVPIIGETTCPWRLV